MENGYKLYNRFKSYVKYVTKATLDFLRNMNL